jgi:hypothetical protein
VNGEKSTSSGESINNNTSGPVYLGTNNALNVIEQAANNEGITYNGSQSSLPLGSSGAAEISKNGNVLGATTIKPSTKNLMAVSGKASIGQSGSGSIFCNAYGFNILTS